MATRSSEKRAAATTSEVDELNRLILALANTVRVRVREGLLARGHDLTPSHTHLIPNLAREGMRLSDLAERLKLTLARTGQLVQELEEVGYVEKLPDESDGRAKRVVYTRRGLGLIADSDRIQHEVAEEYAQILGGDRISRLRKLLEQLDDGLQKSDDAAEA